MFKLHKINLNRNNRMLRIGFGYHEGNPFFRIDLWWIGIRITKSKIKHFILQYLIIKLSTKLQYFRDWATWFWIMVIATLWIIALIALIKTAYNDLNPSNQIPIEQPF